MPDKMVAMLVRFLEQNKEQLSQMANTKEFSTLQEDEIKEIETSSRIFSCKTMSKGLHVIAMKHG